MTSLLQQFASAGTAEREAEILALGPWFHNLHLPDGAQTAPGHALGDFPAFKWAELAPHLPEDLRGWTALDIGCNAGFYNAQRFTLNVTRADMIAAGWSPSVRLFEASACGTPIVSDWWEGLGDVLRVGEEILVARDADDALRAVRGMPEDERLALGAAARARVLASHTAAHRAAELEAHVAEILAGHLA